MNPPYFGGFIGGTPKLPAGEKSPAPLFNREDKKVESGQRSLFLGLVGF
jgi:hypothetical protein